MLSEEGKDEMNKAASGLKKIGEDIMDSGLGRMAKYTVYIVGGAISLGIILRALTYVKGSYNKFRDKV